MSTHYPIYLFGPGRVVDLQGAALVMRSRKQLAMLAYLASEYSIAHTREALMALFWPDDETASAQNNLRVALSRLKEMASKTGVEDADLLRVDRHTVQLHSAWVGRVDVNAFEALLTCTRQHSHAHRNQCAHCQAALKEAVNLYAGEFLSGLVLDDCTELAEWLFVQRERLRTQAIEAYADLATFAETSNDLSAALEHAQCLIELDPLRELAYRQQMRVWAKRSDRNAALAAYARCRQQVQEALGIEPEPETQHLHAQILSGGVALAPQEASTTSPRHNLPQQLTSFVGRDDELAQLHERLTQPNNRLLSLIGPGGVGKTRLALQLALQLAQQIAVQPLLSFDDGVCFVSLAQVTTIEAIPSAIAEALHLLISPSEQSALDQLIAQIGNKHLLLVLDNFEHLMDGAGLLVTLLQRTPNTVLLVTSRERLNLLSEDCIEVAGLPTPANANDASADQYAAVRLFVDRAYRMSKQFKLSAEERPHVVRICQLVEGFPLGIELAATWVGDFNCQEIVQALSSGLHGLETTARDIEPARRSLRAVFRTSWRLLSEAEQRTLAALSVFQGGFSKAAALAVAGATQSLLSALRKKSLLRHDGSQRYDMHALVQQFSAEALAAQTEFERRVRHQHSQHFLSQLAVQAAALDTLDAGRVANGIQPDWDNVVAAWRDAVAREAVDVLQPAFDGLIGYCGLRIPLPETHALLDDAIARFEDSTKPDHQALPKQIFLCRLLTARARFYLLINLDTLMTASERALTLAQQINDIESIVYNRVYQAAACEYRGDYVRGLALAEHGLHLAQQHGLEIYAGWCMEEIGYIFFKLGNFARATEMYGRLQEIHNRTGRLARLSLNGLGILGCMALDEGRYEASLHYFQQELSGREAMADKRLIADAQHMLACAWQQLGHYDRALALETLSAQSAGDLGNRSVQSAALLGKAGVHRLLGQSGEALACAEAAVALVRDYNAPVLLIYAQLQLAEAQLALAQTERDWQQAEATFAKVAATAQTAGNRPAEYEAMIGLAEVARRRGLVALAMERLAPVLPYLPTQSANSWAAPVQGYVRCVHILRAAHDSNAEAVLGQGVRFLDHLAQQMSDDDLRQNFLSAVPEHCELRVLVGFSPKKPD